MLAKAAADGAWEGMESTSGSSRASRGIGRGESDDLEHVASAAWAGHGAPSCWGCCREAKALLGQRMAFRSPGLSWKAPTRSCKRPLAGDIVITGPDTSYQESLQASLGALPPTPSITIQWCGPRTSSLMVRSRLAKRRQDPENANHPSCRVP